MVNDTAYEPMGERRVYLTDRYLSTMGLMSIYASRTGVYPKVSENHNLNNPAKY